MSAARDETMPGGTTGGTPGVLLAHHLKQLKLPTVLREYDKVARGVRPGRHRPPRATCSGWSSWNSSIANGAWSNAGSGRHASRR